MQPYIAIRGASNQRVVTRDARDGHFASLVIGHADGNATVYELSLENPKMVVLTVKYPGHDTKTLHVDDGFLDFEPVPAKQKAAKDGSVK